MNMRKIALTPFYSRRGCSSWGGHNRSAGALALSRRDGARMYKNEWINPVPRNGNERSSATDYPMTKKPASSTSEQYRRISTALNIKITGLGSFEAVRYFHVHTRRQFLCQQILSTVLFIMSHKTALSAGDLSIAWNCARVIAPAESKARAAFLKAFWRTCWAL